MLGAGQVPTQTQGRKVGRENDWQGKSAERIQSLRLNAFSHSLLDSQADSELIE